VAPRLHGTIVCSGDFRFLLTVRRPVSSGIVKGVNRQNSQEVCPHNNPKFVQITSEEAFWPREGVRGANLIELVGMDQAEFSRRLKKSSVKRAKRVELLRKVAVALGNYRHPKAVPVLAKALVDGEPADPRSPGVGSRSRRMPGCGQSWSLRLSAPDPGTRLREAGGSSSRTEASDPADGPGILCHARISGQEENALDARLRDENPIERVAV
jgi:hypothetical protein